MEVVEVISKALVVLVILVDSMILIHLKFLNNSLQILVQMMMILDPSLEEEKIKKTLIIQKEIHLDLVVLEDLGDLMMMMISLVVE